jgi:hypothetical protein
MQFIITKFNGPTDYGRFRSVLPKYSGLLGGNGFIPRLAETFGHGPLQLSAVVGNAKVYLQRTDAETGLDYLERDICRALRVDGQQIRRTSVIADGLWPFFVHWNIIDEAFPGMSKNDLQILKDAS